MLELSIGKNKEPLLAYVDTGCTGCGLSIHKNQIKNIDIGVKINVEPTPCIMADGHRIGADEYVTTIELCGRSKDVVISVIDPDIDLGYVPVEEVAPLIGRQFIDAYNVFFKGKARKIALYEC